MRDTIDSFPEVQKAPSLLAADADLLLASGF
jgi:hypothetical protein